MSQNVNIVISPGQKAKITQIKIRRGIFLCPGALVCSYEVNGRKDIHKLKAQVAGTVKTVECKAGDELSPK